MDNPKKPTEKVSVAGLPGRKDEFASVCGTGASFCDPDTENYRELYTKLLQIFPDAIIHTDLFGNITFISPKSVVLFGYYSDSEIIGRNFADFLEPEFRGTAAKSLNKTFSGASGRTSLYKLLRKDGATFWAEINSISINDDNGLPKEILITIRNITERIQFEKVQEALFRISEAVNTTPDLNNLFKSIHEVIKEMMPADNFYIALYDTGSGLLSFPYFVDKFDETPESGELQNGLTEYVLRTGRDILVDEKEHLEMREQGLVELVGPPAKIWLGIALKILGETIGVMALQDYENSKAYGEQEKELLIFISEQIASAIDKKRQEEALLRFTEELQISRDMLEERASEFARLNELLAESELELQELNASKDKFFSILAHDLRSPFNGLLGFTNYLVEDLDSLSKEEVRNFATQIQGSAKLLFNLIENLLQWTRLQSGKMQCQPIRLDVSEVVTDVISVLIGNAIRKNISLRSEMNHYSYAFADQNMLYSTFQNLIANAIKFTNPGGEVRITGEYKDEYLEVCISDTGIGIRKEDMEKLFRIDVQHSTIGTSKEKGTGLGLILCKELVEKQGGTITIESEFGKGTKFIFTLPKEKGHTSEA